ncbi:MAG: VOC family protein [Myxococcota bacterium]|nr:VOC family protein [Myxococcota bacterium]
MLLNVVHININVADLDRSVAFYEALGFSVMQVFEEDKSAEEMASMDFGGTRMRGAVMSIGDDPRASTKIELLQWFEPRSEPMPHPTETSGGVARIALRTKNLLGFAEELRAKGIVFEREPQEIDMAGASRFCTFRDPDGVLLELLEF